MSIRIEAKDLEAAYIKAARQLGCSTINLEITPIKPSRKGFFGFFQKDGLFEVVVKKEAEKKAKKSKPERSEREIKELKHHTPKPLKAETSNKSEDKSDLKSQSEPKLQSELKTENRAEVRSAKEQIAKKPLLNIDHSIFDSFHKIDENKPSQDDILLEIRAGLDKLLIASSFDIEVSELSIYDADTIYIKLDGADAALMIGKEGYRYKAISYLLFNWINARYNKGIRLEIAEFLKNQESSMATYLSGVIERVELIGKAQTKPLDGVLVKIALEQLRDRFPDKYVGIKNSDEGKFIVINDFHKK